MPAKQTGPKSRTYAGLRKYATQDGKAPVVPKTLANIAPKLAADGSAKPPSGSTAQNEAAHWMPSTASRRALADCGRKTMSKPLLRAAAAVAIGDRAAPVVRAVVAAEADDYAVSVALGVVEAMASGASVFVAVPDAETGALLLAKLAVFPAVAGRVTELNSLASQSNNAPSSGSAVVAVASAVAGPVTADVCVACVTASRDAHSGKVDKAHVGEIRVALSSVTRKRLVVVGASVRAVTSLTIKSALGAAGDDVTAVVAPLAPVEPLRAVTMNYFVTQGAAKYQLLHSLVTASGATKKILVRFATKQIASFYCDVLLAANVPALVLCDVDDDIAYDAVNGSDDDTSLSASAAHANANIAIPGLPAPRTVASVTQQFEACAGGCVLLSAYGLSTSAADIVLEFDPPMDLEAFVRSTMRASCPEAAATHIMVLDPAAHVAAVAAIKHHARVLTASVPQGVAAPGKASRTEVTTTAGSADPPSWKFNKLPSPSASATHIQGMQLRSLAKKLFQINNRGYEAYKSYMHYYALLRPTSVFDPYNLDLDVVAEQFGLESAPLLDLRLRSNEFRPKEDYSKFAAQRQRRDRRAFRQYADEHILPEAPEAD